MRTVPNRKIDYLLIDISNSFTKVAFSTKDRVARSSRLATRNLTTAWLRRFLRGRSVRAIVVASVVPAKNSAIRKAAGKSRTLFINSRCELGVGVDYPNPGTIGADRLANAAAVAHLYGCPAIVVDFGTAVTFDVVSGRGDYVGGVIAPGLEAMTSFLYQRTALLPKLTLREPLGAIGRTTRAAMMSGAVYGYRGLVREIIARIREESSGLGVRREAKRHAAFVGGSAALRACEGGVALRLSPHSKAVSRQKVRVVATGGYSQLIARRLPEIEAVHSGLTLEGLRLVANLNL